MMAPSSPDQFPRQASLPPPLVVTPPPSTLTLKPSCRGQYLQLCSPSRCFPIRSDRSFFLISTEALHLSQPLLIFCLVLSSLFISSFFKKTKSLSYHVLFRPTPFKCLLWVFVQNVFWIFVEMKKNVCWTQQTLTDISLCGCVVDADIY